MIRNSLRQILVGMDVLVSIILIGLSYALMPVIALPGYIILGVVDGIQNRFYPETGQTELLTGVVLFTYGLAVLVGLLARGLRHVFDIRPSGQTPLSDVGVPLATIFGLVGVLVALIGLYFVVVDGLFNPVTFLIGGVFLFLSAGLLRYTSHYAGNRQTTSV